MYGALGELGSSINILVPLVAFIEICRKKQINFDCLPEVRAVDWLHIEQSCSVNHVKVSESKKLFAEVDAAVTLLLITEGRLVLGGILNW